MLIVIVRDGKHLSVKTRFITQILKLDSNIQFLYLFRNEQKKFREKLFNNEMELATSLSGILMYFLLIFFLKTPKDLRDGIIRRIQRQQLAPMIRNGGFMSVIFQALYQYVASSARSNNILNFLRKLDSPKIFLIDEFFSLNVVNLKILKKLGYIIYISSDLASDFYGDNCVATKLMYNFERSEISLPDMVIACSERDRIKYEEMGAKNVIYYPNIYPIKKFERNTKDPTPSISIVLHGSWGSRADKSLEDVFKALNRIKMNIKVYMIGKKPQNVPKNVELDYYTYIPSKLEYLKILSKSWIGINLGIHMGGTNQRKYDYAMAGSIVLSDFFGVRGDLLPNEYSYVDNVDLSAKLNQIFELDLDKIVKMGKTNKKYTLSLAEEQLKGLLSAIKPFLSCN